MKILIHRINSVVELNQTPTKFGIEVDVFQHDGAIYTGHDPGHEICAFENWVKHFKHDFLAVNIKQEGIEKEVIRILDEAGIANFFLFDLSFPMLYKLSMSGESRIAIRTSDIEGSNSLSVFRNKIDWVWLDAFESLKFIPGILEILSDYKVCVVSPELHLSRAIEVSNQLLSDLQSFISHFDAVCTKYPEEWEE